mgnify:CR=1 FL=1
MQRRTNGELLKTWLEENGFELGLAQLMLRTKLSHSLLVKMSSGHYGQSVPKEKTRRLICEATGLDMDALFPPVTAGKKAS